MDGQDWKPVVLSKKKNTPPKVLKEKKEEKKEDGFVEPPKMFDVAFGRRVENLRNAKGWKRADLARRMNLKESVIESLEKGKEVYNGQLLHNLKKHLGNEI